jgi:hypothetical protein
MRHKAISCISFVKMQWMANTPSVLSYAKSKWTQEGFRVTLNPKCTVRESLGEHNRISVTKCIWKYSICHVAHHVGRVAGVGTEGW